ncbi:MAG: 50S ribosomal protein L18 [Actinobacteria bacterium]|nr:50S ribosomal protein L18 [Actinomycetota bacterium]
MRTKTERENKRLRRTLRVRSKIKRNNKRNLPKLCVYRSNKYIYGQIVDLVTGRTIVTVSSKSLQIDGDEKGKIKESFLAGKLLAEKAKERNIYEVVFDRGGYKYHGRVKALAEGAREGGLKF